MITNNDVVEFNYENLNPIKAINNYNNININIININISINQMKSLDNKLNYDDIQSLLKINKPGHIQNNFSLQISAGLINSKIVDFLVKKKSNLGESNNNLKLSVSKEINPCIK